MFLPVIFVMKTVSRIKKEPSLKYKIPKSKRKVQTKKINLSRIINTYRFNNLNVNRARLYLRWLIVPNPRIKNLYKIRTKFFKIKAICFIIRALKLMKCLIFNNFRISKHSKSNSIRLHMFNSNKIQMRSQTIFTRETSGSTRKSQTSRGTI